MHLVASICLSVHLSVLSCLNCLTTATSYDVPKESNIVCFLTPGAFAAYLADTVDQLLIHPVLEF